MFSSLRRFNVFQISLILCVPSSAIIHLLSVWFNSPYFPSSSFLIQDVLIVLAIGALFGLFKALLVSGVTSLGKASLRSRLTIGSTVALSLLEGWLYHELYRPWALPLG